MGVTRPKLRKVVVNIPNLSINQIIAIENFDYTDLLTIEKSDIEVDNEISNDFNDVNNHGEESDHNVDCKEGDKFDKNPISDETNTDQELVIDEVDLHSGNDSKKDAGAMSASVDDQPSSPRKKDDLEHEIINSDKKKSMKSKLYGIDYKECDFCYKIFKTKSKLVQHRRIHTQEKPFTCEICSRSFNVKCNMIRHTRVCHNVEI